MKKTVSALVLAAMLAQSNAALAANSFMPGSFKAKMDVNVRSMPSMAGALVNHYLTGQEVVVSAVKGNWCQVNLKNYRNAYVYCPLLTAAVTGDAMALNNLKETDKWLNDNDGEGKNLVNSSLALGESASRRWSSEAYFAGFRFHVAPDGSKSCKFEFNSKSKNGEAFEANCQQVQKDKPAGETVKLGTPKTTVQDPKLKLTGLIKQLMENKEFVGKVNERFSSENQTKAAIHFDLSANENGGSDWTMTMSAGNATITATTPADEAMAKLNLK